MQITNSVACGKGCIYKQIKPPLAGEHAFPLTGFVCMAAHVTLATHKFKEKKSFKKNHTQKQKPKSFRTSSNVHFHFPQMQSVE